MSRAPVWALRTAFRTVGAVAPDVAARWAETIFCTPPRHVPPVADEEFVATGTRFMVRSEGQDIAAWEWGMGPTVLLVHGWGSRAGRFRVLATALLESGFRVVAHDAPAHGRSTGRFASLPEFARALRAVADRAGEIHGIVGHSLGGSAACLAMRRNLEERLRMRWEDLNIASIARELSIPALVIHDREDEEVSFAHGEEIAHALPHARLVATSGLGHRAILRDPEVVRETVAFLREGAE